MMFSFDFLSQVVKLNCEQVNVLCVENKFLFRKLLNTLLSGEAENANIVFSENFVPLEFKKNVNVIYDYYNLTFSSAFIKKLYDDIALYCSSELQALLADFKASYEILFDSIVSEYDYDIVYSEDFNLSSFFKACNLKPAVSGGLSLEHLLQYILIISKYSKIRCFVLFNLHLYFSSNELKAFYDELAYNKVSILIIENNQSFTRTRCEKITVVDDDLCEIVEMP